MEREAHSGGKGLLDGINCDWRRWVIPSLIGVLLVFVSLYNFLLFHTLAELFAITVAVVLAIVAWHTYSFSHNHYLMYLGVGYFWVAALDLFHTLTYHGINMVQHATSSTAIQFWLVARLVEAGLLATAPLFIARPINRITALVAFGAVSTVMTTLVLAGKLPVMFVEGQGLTPVKLYSEYLIIGLMAVAIFVTLRLRHLMDYRILGMIVLSLVFTIASEVSFTLYTNLQDVQLVVGHVLKLFSYWAIFMAVVQTSLHEPYEIMSRTSGTYDAIPIPTLVVNRDGRIQQANREACRVVGLGLKDVLDQDCHDVFHPKRIDKKDCVVCDYLARGELLKDYEIQKEDASWWNFALSPFDTRKHSDLMVHVCADISDRKYAEQSLMNQINYDSLTQLPNRVLAVDRLKQAIELAKRDNKHVAVMFIDLDHFKNINDTLGHLVGDRVLVAVTNILEASIRSTDTLARWGGDEYIVILNDLDAINKARSVADKILQQLSSPIMADNREFLITASIGISGYPENGDDHGTLLSHADAAMYLAKGAGRNTMRFYTADINAESVARLEMEAELRHAIENDELYVHYQPQVRMSDRKVVCAEALLRWHNHKLGNVSPEKFIPLAESIGMIRPIGEWVLHQSCKDLAAWQQQGYTDLRIAVNISSLHFVSEGFVPTIKSIVDEYGIKPQQIIIEITETLLLGDEQRNIELFGQLRELGFKLSLDDFGTGYASVSYLKKFPFTEIKIDRQFVMDADTNANDARLCLAMIRMAHGLGLTVVAEGVETEGQWELLYDNEVEVAQGFMLSKPIPVAEFHDLLLQDSRRNPGLYQHGHA